MEPDDAEGQLDVRAVAAAVPGCDDAIHDVAVDVIAEQKYGDQPGTELANPQTIAVDGAGRLYVADARPPVVKVFNTNGTLLRTISREGGGPGEYRNPWIAARGGIVVVHDPSQSRTMVYDTSGTYLRGWTSFCCHQNEIAVDSALRVVVPAVVRGREGTAPYVRYSIEGRIIDTISVRGDASERLWTVARQGSDGKPGSGSTSVVIPYTPRQLFAWHPAGGFVSGWSASMRLYRSHGSDSIAFVSAPNRATSIPEPMRQAAVDTAIAQFTPMVGPARAHDAVHLADVPNSAPAFTRLLVDEEGNVWARQLLGAATNETAFRIFAPNRTDLGRALVPVRVPEWSGIAFGQQTLFVRTEDQDGHPIVIRFGVRRSSETPQRRTARVQVIRPSLRAVPAAHPDPDQRPRPGMHRGGVQDSNRDLSGNGGAGKFRACRPLSSSTRC